MPNTLSGSGSDKDRRRSQRVILSIAVHVASTPRKANTGNTAPFEEDAATMVVNAHGALILLAAKVEKGEILLLKNPRTQAEQMGKVIHVGSSAAGKTQIAVEFTTPAPEFWGIVFPPEDWGTTVAAKPEPARAR